MIGCSKAEAIQEFAQDTGYPREYIYVNPSQDAYKAFGMKTASSFSELKGDGKMNSDTTSGVFSGMAWSLWKTVSRGTQGDVYQLGGEVLLSPQREILFRKANTSSQDYLSADKVRELIKI